MFSNPALVQLTWKHSWLTQCLLTVLGKNKYNPKTISNLTVTINQQHYTTIADVRHGTWITTNLSSYATL